jgi:PPOX class probable F420-dependent enzyme
MATIPESFQDLVDGPPVAALTTVMSDGYPQTTVVWCNSERPYMLVNTMRGFLKERNMRRDHVVTLFCFDPRQPLRSLEVRGRVMEMTEVGAMEHLDHLSMLYTGAAPYFGACVPAALKEKETPVLCRILPRRVVTLDATRPRRAGEPSMSAPAQSRWPGHIAPGTPLPSGCPIPDSHRDLLIRPLHAVLTTMMPDGQPQSSLVWCDDDGACARINTTVERQKGRNMLANPRVSLLVVDPEDTARYLSIRGDVEIIEEGALRHLDELTRRYTAHPRFYGCVYPLEQQARETRIIVRIHARRITLDAIHK